MAKRRDFSKDTSRRRGIRENIEDVKGKTRTAAINPSTDAGMRIAGAPSKSERKGDRARLKRIEQQQRLEEEARQKKIKAAQEERKARMKAEAEAMKLKRTGRGGGGKSAVGMGIRPPILGPMRKLKMLRFGGKVHRGRPAQGNKA